MTAKPLVEGAHVLRLDGFKREGRNMFVAEFTALASPTYLYGDRVDKVWFFGRPLYADQTEDGSAGSIAEQYVLADVKRFALAVAASLCVTIDEFRTNPPDETHMSLLQLMTSLVEGKYARRALVEVTVALVTLKNGRTYPRPQWSAIVTEENLDIAIGAAERQAFALAESGDEVGANKWMAIAKHYMERIRA